VLNNTAVENANKRNWSWEDEEANFSELSALEDLGVEFGG